MDKEDQEANLPNNQGWEQPSLGQQQPEQRLGTSSRQRKMIDPMSK